MMPGNPVVGGTVLRRPAIQSPNFVAGSQGWTINADGSAEFDSLTIRGVFEGTDFVVNAAGVFVYSGSPAFGNLTASIASASGTDAHGNPYQAGIVSYGTAANFVQLLTNIINLGFTSQFSPAAVFAPAAGEVGLESGEVGSGDTMATIFLNSAQSSISGFPFISLNANEVITSGSLVASGLVLNGQTITVPQSPPGTVPAAPSSYNQTWGAGMTGILNSIIAALTNAGIY